MRLPDNANIPHDYNKGDYWKHPTKPLWYACLPNGSIISIQDWMVILHPDNTISTTNSVFDLHYKWVGTCIHGLWERWF